MLHRGRLSEHGVKSVNRYTEYRSSATPCSVLDFNPNSSRKESAMARISKSWPYMSPYRYMNNDGTYFVYYIRASDY